MKSKSKKRAPKSVTTRRKPKPATPANPKPAAGICHHLQTWSDELAMDPATLKKSLIRSDYRPEPNVPIPLKVIVQALFGEEHVEKVKAMRLDNEERERDAAVAKRELVRWEDVSAWLNQRVFGPQVAAFDAAPREIDRDWVEKTLKPLVQNKLEAPPK